MPNDQAKHDSSSSFNVSATHRAQSQHTRKSRSEDSPVRRTRQLCPARNRRATSLPHRDPKAVLLQSQHRTYDHMLTSHIKEREPNAGRPPPNTIFRIPIRCWGGTTGVLCGHTLGSPTYGPPKVIACCETGYVSRRLPSVCNAAACLQRSSPIPPALLRATGDTGGHRYTAAVVGGNPIKAECVRSRSKRAVKDLAVLRNDAEGAEIASEPRDKAIAVDELDCRDSKSISKFGDVGHGNPFLLQRCMYRTFSPCLIHDGTFIPLSFQETIDEICQIIVNLKRLRLLQVSNLRPMSIEQEGNKVERLYIGCPQLRAISLEPHRSWRFSEKYQQWLCDPGNAPWHYEHPPRSPEDWLEADYAQYLADPLHEGFDWGKTSWRVSRTTT